MTPPRSDALVLFGATGDLADKKIFPALYELAKGAPWTSRSLASPGGTGAWRSCANA